MIDEFFQHDLAITGGGITPFEANASGLPCIVIANETFEVAVGKAVQSLGSSIYAGYHKEIQLPLFPEDLPIEQMSRAGMNNINLLGAQRVVDSLLETSR
jgi:spore coat polysaccharide biosynthesis predicted glycosyltransferase SpsG